MAVKLFFCYAREDESFLNELKMHLEGLRRQGLIEMWHDRNISAGTDWTKEIDNHLDTAQIILLLVSQYFIASDYCYSIEMKKAMDRHERREAVVIPIILRPVYFQLLPFGKLQVLPSDAKPVTDSDWHSLDRAFFDVAEGIRNIVEKLTPKPSIPSPGLADQPQEIRVTSSTASVPKRKLARPIPVVRNKEFSLLRTLAWHSKAVSSVAFSPDGQILASGSLDKTIKLWNPATGNLLHSLTEVKNEVQSIAISPDGMTLVSGGYIEISIWHLPNGSRFTSINTINFLDYFKKLKTSSTIFSVAISPVETYASGGANKNKTIKLWGRVYKDSSLRSYYIGMHRKLIGHTEAVSSIAFSPDGRMLASGSWDKTIKLWDPKSGELFGELIGHSGSVSGVAISSDGLTLASGSGDSSIKLWNLHTGQLLQTLRGHLDGILSVAFSPDGQTLASGSEDKTIKIWGSSEFL